MRGKIRGDDEAVFAIEVDKPRKDGCKPKEQLTLEPYHRDHEKLKTAHLKPGTTGEEMLAQKRQAPSLFCKLQACMLPSLCAS